MSRRDNISVEYSKGLSLFDTGGILQKFCENIYIFFYTFPMNNQFVFKAFYFIRVKLVVISMPENVPKPPQFIQDKTTLSG